MVIKHCPECHKQLPVACKMCTSCGHTFSARRVSSVKKGACQGSSAMLNKKKTKTESPAEIIEALSQSDPAFELPFRRTGRVQREKPNFYDALAEENQMKKLRSLKRKKSKEEGPKPSSPKTVDKKKNSSSSNSTQVVVRKRGRPPRLHPSSVSSPPEEPKRVPVKIRTTSSSLLRRPQLSSVTHSEAQEDLLKDISPERAVQLHIILEDINRKWSTVNWRI